MKAKIMQKVNLFEGYLLLSQQQNMQVISKLVYRNNVAVTYIKIFVLTILIPETTLVSLQSAGRYLRISIYIQWKLDRECGSGLRLLNCLEQFRVYEFTILIGVRLTARLKWHHRRHVFRYFDQLEELSIKIVIKCEFTVNVLMSFMPTIL